MKRGKEITTEDFDRKYATLPDDIADAFESVDTSRRIFEIGRAHGLAVDKVGDLAREIGYVMLGFVPTTEFIADLAEIVGDREKSGAIANEINQKIFLPIRESIRKASGGQWSGNLAPATGRAVILPPPPRPATPAPKPTPPPAPPLRSAAQPPPPKPMAPKPPMVPPASSSAEPRKPEPMIIRPLPMPPPIGPRISEQETMNSEQEAAMGIKKVEAGPPLPETRISEQKISEVSKGSEVSKVSPTLLRTMPVPMAPVSTPAPASPKPTQGLGDMEQGIGVRPSAPATPPLDAAPASAEASADRRGKPPSPAPEAGYDRLQEAFKQEYEKFEQRQAPAQSPYVIKKEDMQKKQISEVSKVSEASRAAPAQPPQTTPKQTGADPYKEPVEGE